MRHAPLVTLALFALALLSCGRTPVATATVEPPSRVAVSTSPPPTPGAPALATVAGGCFWCLESDFDALPGILSTTSGYTGGGLENPTYEQVSAGGTGHYEVVQVAFDPAVVSYGQVLDFFWRSVDPTDPGGQFCDRGDQYRTAIFAHDAEQHRIAEESKRALEASKPFTSPVVTPVVAASAFWPAEGYHQDYAQKNPVRYRFYRSSCGRDSRIQAVWREQAREH